jgi:TRAP-type C4-dicarboxylate transport system substrate-binding protein
MKFSFKQQANEVEEIENEKRRRFFELSGKYGVTAAIVAAGAGTLLSTEASAQSAIQEQEREKAAKHTAIIATAYRLEQQIGFPFSVSEAKNNIQNMTKGKVYVKVAANKVLGGGTELAKKTQANTIQIGQHSISNLAPFAKEVDLINLPYWCAENQKFTNLVHSNVWKDLVEKPAAANGFKIFSYLTFDPRTCSVGKKFDEPIRVPSDLKGVKFRVPGSKILAQLYTLLGANPTPIAWGETAPAIKSGVADALDPAIHGLWVFGFADILNWVTFSAPVPDGNVLTMSKAWFDSLDPTTQAEIDFAAEVTNRQQLANVPSSRAYCMSDMAKAGVQFYVPSKDEMAQWVEAAGHQRKEWDPYKVELAGSIKNFDRLLEAANTYAGYYVHDIKA